MKKLITVFAVVVLMLSTTCVSWAVPTVSSPPDSPSWWNTECEYYAYGWWSSDIIGGGTTISPPDDVTHWASNFLNNTDFEASIGWTDQTVTLNLDNVPRLDLKKEIYIYINGDTNSTQQNIDSTLNTDSGIFSGVYGGSIGNGLWTYFVSGEIIPQPDFVNLQVHVPGMTNVTNIWAGENCLVPEPATVCLLGLGALGLLRKRRA